MQNWTTAEANSTVGQMRTANGFTFLRVYDAGHMVSADTREVLLSSGSEAHASQHQCVTAVIFVFFQVPRDQPQNALAMLNAFISGKI